MTLKNVVLCLIVAYLALNRTECTRLHSCGKNRKGHKYFSEGNNGDSCASYMEGGKSKIMEWSKHRSKCECRDDVKDVAVITIATNQTDGFKRYLRSARVYGFEDVTVLGMGEIWKGGDIHRYPGGGYKVNLLKEELAKYKEDKDKVVLFTDSYDVVFMGRLDEIVDRFKSMNVRILFSAEGSCWPDKSLASKYPEVGRGKRFLNSGGIIGYANDFYEILNAAEIKDTDDDQLFYTKIYLNDNLREKHSIKLDHKSEIFQNLYAAIEDVELRFKGNDAYLQNIAYNTVPLIVHGNGRSKLVLNSLGNYIAHAWNPEEGCMNCWDDTIELDAERPEIYPKLLIAIFIMKPMPFMDEFFDGIYKQAYPKSKLDLFIYNAAAYHEPVIENFIEKHGEEYRSVKRIMHDDEINEVAARNLAIDYCLLKECAGYFSIDSEAHLDNEHTLKLLVEQQRGIVAPLLVRPFKAWSNFWGAITEDGFYARSTDYMEIIHNERRGLWNVPFISTCYLVNATILKNKGTRPSYAEGDLDPDMAFAYANRERDLFMYVNNRLEFGHLVTPDSFNASLTNPEMYQIFENKLDWERRYIHENYTAVLKGDSTPIQPCPDVYWFPIVTERFTKEFVEIMEAFGKWSDGSNKDPRLAGGYENVPTRDIHMNQVGLEQHWLYFLQEYVRPLQELVFLGYYHDDPRLEGGYEAVPTRDIHMTQVGLDESWLEFLNVYVRPLMESVFTGYSGDPPRSLMNFIVRYRPDEQPSLKPHHDSSTYTINIALNRAGIDYEGGGCRFIRYNCSVTDTKVGWMLLHPGRLTHYHEGLKVESGTRYIMISFVDP